MEQNRRNSVYDDPKSGRPQKARTVEIFNKIENFVLTERRVKILIIDYDMGISETIFL